MDKFRTFFPMGGQNTYRHLFILNLKWIVLFTILFCSFQTAHGQTAWSEPIPVSHGYLPNFAIDPKSGTIHVISVGLSGGITYVITDSVGNVIQNEMTIPGSEKEGYGPTFFSPAIAIDTDGYPHVLSRECTNSADRLYNIYYIYQNAAGWSSKLKISNNVYRGYVVDMDIDDENLVHAARNVVEKNPWGYVIYNRIEDGAVDKIESGFRYQRGDDRLDIFSTPEGVLHLVLGCPGIEGSPTYEGAVTYFRSTDAGDTWTDGLDIHSYDCPERNGCPSVFADTLGNVYIVYGARVDNTVAGQPSVRYVKINSKGSKVVDKPVTQIGELSQWDHKSFGLAQVAGTEDGAYLVISYLTKDGGDLYVITSTNGGESWSVPLKIAETVGGDANESGQNIHRMLSYRNHFYIVFQDKYTKQIKMQYLRDVGDLAPTADIGGPYTGLEGQTVQFDASGSYDSGQNQGIKEYAWDLDDDQVYEVISSSPIIEQMYTDDFQGKIRLRITDHAGKTDFDSTTIQIINVPPVVNAGDDQSSNEGEPLQFASQITDPGNDTFVTEWNFGDGTSEEGSALSHTYLDDGVYSVIVTVTDDDGGTGVDSLHVTVFNLPPTAEAGGPYTAPIHIPITFTGSATDPGVLDQLTYEWDLDNNTSYETQGQEVIGTFHYNGNYVVWLKVSDGDGGEAVDSALVYIANDPPVISTIPDQTINEGGLFTPVNLDQYVVDPDQPDDQLEWTVTGQQSLLVTLENHILTVTVPDSEWFGQETLSLEVTDPGFLSDETQIVFTVLPVNDRPVLSDVPDYSFMEDDTISISIDYLRSLVMDVDDNLNDLQFSISGNHNIQYAFVGDSLYLSALAQWHGQEKIAFTVTDTSGAFDTDSSLVTVISIPDYPDDFELIDPMFVHLLNWPDTLEFEWQSSKDADGDVVNYEWTLSWQGYGFSTDIKHITQDTVYYFPTDTLQPDGTYLWWVTAMDGTNSVRSENRGILIIGEYNSVDDPSVQVPLEYRLLQNYPNPFNPETRITYHLPEKTLVRLSVFNTLGQEICVLVNEIESAGIHTAVWNGKRDSGASVPSGIYICRMQAGGKVFHQKMMFLQ